ncbi:acetyl-CoA acetyltransferase (plasmid) [Variovorax sp. SRS16]|nr:acetyl-CoA acetyltransferase [Variovorax sp. SRS16]
MALITLAGRPRSDGAAGLPGRSPDLTAPDLPWEQPFKASILNLYGLVAARHMHEFGTTGEQLAWIKVAASTHAALNPSAMLRKVVTTEEVLASPLISGPLHKLDCCVVSDGGGALVVVHPDVARSLRRPVVNVLGAGEAVKGLQNGQVDLTWSAAAISGPRAFEEAGVKPADIQYASIYDSFTITVLMQLEDLGSRHGSGTLILERQ